MKLILSTLIVCFSLQSFADCPNDVTYYKQGDKVGCDSYGFGVNAEADNREKLDLGLSYKNLNDMKDEKIDILNQRLGVYKDGYDELSKKESDQKLEKTLYALGGALLMFVAIKTASQINPK